ncbi:hypothetical protein EDD21DRAFT_55270 [Dissophora ornata]|nr:hypothetical protein BGZ58_010848 [Dissophora ornata]KAI8595096.1 hypothetical protein EDD21DRAFT_55270 [Dissophora ornata]
MNYLFATNSIPEANLHAAIACNTSLSPTTGPSDPVSPTTHSTPQDIELLIEIDSSFHGVLLGLPEESPGAVLNATVILHVRKKPIRASKLTATIDGRIKVQCSDGATFGPEHYRERVLAHKDWVLWEAGGNATVSGPKNHIPVGTHYFPLSIQLDGALPPTFSGKYGSIRYILSSTLLRPIFHSDVNTVQEIEIKRCLVNQSARADSQSAPRGVPPDLGSLLVNQLSRAGISSVPNDHGDMQTSELLPGPMTITHHNTHKELLRYTATSPPIAHLEGALLQLDLALEPLPPGSYIYSVAYGIKELIYYRTSAMGNLADNKSEILYPIGQQTVIIPRDKGRERSMCSTGAGASTRQLLELRLVPELTNVDTITPLIEVQHRITCNIVIVLPDSVNHRNGRNDSQIEQQQGGTSSGGGILRRLNLTSQPNSPSLNLVDSSGAEVVNNAVFLGEPTHSIIEPVSAPATVELNDTPPPPPASRLESIILEFPIILTSRYPSPSQPQRTTAYSNAFAQGHIAEDEDIGSNGASQFEQPAPWQENPLTAIPTTGTSIHANTSPTLTPALGSPLSSSPSSVNSLDMAGQDQDESSSSSQPSPSADQSTPEDSGDRSPSATYFTRAPLQSGISAGLRAAAAAATLGSGQIGSLSRPPSYGRQVPQPTQPDIPIQEEPPKYEDVIDMPERSEYGLGITMSRTMPMPMPNQRCQSTSPRSMNNSGGSPSRALYQTTGSRTNRGRGSPSNDGSASLMMSRDVSRSSPRAIRGHGRSESSTSMLMSTSLARSHVQSMSTLLAMSPTLQAGSPQQNRQRQRSIDVATMIIGSLGRNGGYLSHLPTLSPPAYAD